MAERTIEAGGVVGLVLCLLKEECLLSGVGIWELTESASCG